MVGFSYRSTWLAGLLATVLLVGCGSRPVNRAPVEDRGLSAGKSAPVAVDARGQPVKQLPGYENAGKPGYYTVKQGDTLYKIGTDAGYSWKDIARWSGLENPAQVEVGQVLRIVPPAGVVAPPTVAVAKPITSSSVTPTVVAPAGSTSSAAGAASAAKPSTPAPAAGTAVASADPGATSASGAAAAADEIAWIWPSNGPVLATFDEVKNKGLDLGGKPGDPVLAAADGRVVYVGAGLRGYGNLIILKHNNTYLTAYAHNQALLVKEDQSVRQGQKIAEMGDSDADRVKLHFEVRRQGKPIDPSTQLPPR